MNQKSEKNDKFVHSSKVFNGTIVAETVLWPCQNSPRQQFSNFILSHIKKSWKTTVLLNVFM